MASKEVVGNDPTGANGVSDKMAGGLGEDGDEDTGMDELMIPAGKNTSTSGHY